MTTQTENRDTENHVQNLNSHCLILIVDDSETDRVTYRRYLESSDQFKCHILDCESAEEAIEQCRVNCPDLILLDYLLPAASGLDFLQNITQQLEYIPSVIMLTGQGNEKVAVEAMKQGVKDYLVKGQLTSQTLVRSVTNVLVERALQSKIDRQRQQRELFTRISLSISRLVELSQILQVAVEGTRELIGCDRTLVYRLDHEMNGTIVVESVSEEWPRMIDHHIEDPGLHPDQAFPIQEYLKGQNLVISDIEANQLTDSRRQILSELHVKAVLVVPIVFQDFSASNEPVLWGLLVAHYCKTVHEWQPDELSFLEELAIPMAIAIQQAELLSDLKATLNHQQVIEDQLNYRLAEIEQANLHLSQATRVLEKRNRELDEFSHIVSHDLQAPLRGIANLADWIVGDLEGKLPPENQQQLSLIQSRVVQMSGFITGLLEYARVGRENITPTTVNISQLLEEIVDLLAPSPEFQISFADDLPTIKTQSLLLKQVISNLIDNAIKYHDRRNGHIQILVVDQGPILKFTITDDGPGINSEHHEKIFRIFQTLPGTASTKGTGIGLAVVKKIIEGQGGTVWVEPESQQGSAFSFTWLKNSVG